MKKPTKPKLQCVYLRKGLSRAEALKAAKKKATADFRGFSYEPKTGKAVML